MDCQLWQQVSILICFQHGVFLRVTGLLLVNFKNTQTGQATLFSKIVLNGGMFKKNADSNTLDARLIIAMEKVPCIYNLE